MEVNSLLDKQLNRLYAWHNARYHLASCLAMQKLGLFHHLQFSQEGQDEVVMLFSILHLIIFHSIMFLSRYLNDLNFIYQI